MASTATSLHKVAASPLRDRSLHRFQLEDEVVEVRVRESSRAHMARIIVGPRRPLEVIVPIGFVDADVAELLDAKRAWIMRKVAASREIAARPPQLGLDRPCVVWLAGVTAPVERGSGDRSIAVLADGRLVVAGGDPGGAISRWYRREARSRIRAVAADEAARLGLSFDSIGIRDPKTRWGSCSRRGHLSFSWRLVIAPADVLSYVVVHELCHLREPSHSKSFWRMVEASRPRWQEQARWLREHGQELHDYEPAISAKHLI
jgi:predicted metal-dependent hydrolase